MESCSMGAVALRSESGKTGMSSREEDDTQEKCCPDPGPNLDLPPDGVHWRIDSTFRMVVETLAGSPASVTHRSLRYNR